VFEVHTVLENDRVGEDEKILDSKPEVNVSNLPQKLKSPFYSSSLASCLLLLLLLLFWFSSIW